MSSSPVSPTIRRAGVDLDGLMTVLGKHLYSTPMVAIRELVQNAHDSITRRRLEDPGWQGPARIDVIPDRAGRTLRIIDTGAGLTEHEIHAYLATVGVGYTRSLREANNDDGGLIGMFGLGFLSAFVLARRVSVRTTSYQSPQSGHLYLSTNAEQYSVAPMEARAVGTEVSLELHQEFEGLTHGATLRNMLGRYCALLREPIHVDGDSTPINQHAPPWRPGSVILHPVQRRKVNLEFALRFERDFEPICTIDLVPEDKSDAVGMLWVQDGATYGTSDNRNLSVFLRGMLLDDDARDLLPSWAGFVGGVLESNQLTPTASREDLQRDEHYHAVRHAISEALIRGLGHVAQTQPEAWRRVLMRHNEALLGASLCDDRLFDLMKDHLRIRSSQGELHPQWLVHKGAVHVMLDRDNDFESMLFRSIGVPIALGYSYAVLPFLRRWTMVRGLRLVELGTEQGNLQLFKKASLPQEEAEWLAANLTNGERVIISTFAPTELPLIVVPDRDALLKQRLDADATDKRMSFAALSLARQFTSNIDAKHTARLYININNPAVQFLLRAHREGAPNLDTALKLLKSFKIIINARQQDGASELTGALRDLTESVARLLNYSEPA